MKWEGCDLPHYDVLWSECRYHLQFKFIFIDDCNTGYCLPCLPRPGPIHHAGPTHSLSGIWQTFFTRGCQIKTGEHRDDFNFNLLSSRCHAASWYRDKQWKYFSSHDLIVIIIRANKNNIMAPDPFKARQFPEFLYPLPPALSPSLRNSSYSWIPRLPDISSLIPGDIRVQDCCVGGLRCRMMAGARWEISGFVIVKRRARVKARRCPGPDITLLQRNIIFIRHPGIMEFQSGWHQRKRVSAADGLWNEMLSFCDGRFQGIKQHHRDMDDNC